MRRGRTLAQYVVLVYEGLMRWNNAPLHDYRRADEEAKTC